VREVLILDYKFGRNIVEPTTKQGGGYAALTYNEFPNTKEVWFGIIQPANPYRTELVKWTQERCKEEIQNPLESMRSHPELFEDHFYVSAKGCAYCPHACTSKCGATKTFFAEILEAMS